MILFMTLTRQDTEMIKTQCLLVCILGCFVLGSSAGVASFIKPCKLDDNKCVIASAQSALPVIADGGGILGMPKSDPLHIDTINADANNLRLRLNDVQVTGTGKAKFLDFRYDPSAQTMNFVIELPLDIRGKYDLKGKILFFEAVGNGDVHIYTDKILLNVTLKTKTIEKKGKKHWKITGFDYTFDLKKKVTFELGNLFGGDKVKAKPFTDFLDESWKDVVIELGGPVFKAVIKECVNNVNIFFQNTSTDELQIS